jgi:hypothetical protein
MGCDIHAFIEYRNKDHDTNEWPWRSFSGEICLGRFYDIFGLMAGVRGERPPLVQPRGMPEDASFIAEFQNSFRVSNEFDGVSREVHPKTAEEWVSRGISHYLNDAHTQVSDPDAHTHSWLTLPELKDVLKKRASYGCDYKAVVAAMASLEKNGMVTRLVFWFDN